MTTCDKNLVMEPIIPLDFSTAAGQEGSGERRDAAENRQLLLRAAADLFDQVGVAAVNMADIAKRANVGKGTLYRRFANKGELSHALLDESFRQFQNQQLASLRDLTAEGRSPLEQLEYFLEKLVAYRDRNLDLMIEIDRITFSGKIVNVNIPHFWEQMTIRGLLLQAQKAGELRTELDIDYLTSALLAPLDGRILRAHRLVKGYDVARITAGLISLLHGLRTP